MEIHDYILNTLVVYIGIPDRRETSNHQNQLSCHTVHNRLVSFHFFDDLSLIFIAVKFSPKQAYPFLRLFDEIRQGLFSELKDEVGFGLPFILRN